jgi:hypothetical protein
MNQHTHHAQARDMVGIAREASFYDWLIGRSRVRRPDLLPPQLYTDVGLPAKPRDRDRSDWRRYC